MSIKDLLERAKGKFVSAEDVYYNLPLFRTNHEITGKIVQCEDNAEWPRLILDCDGVKMRLETYRKRLLCDAIIRTVEKRKLTTVVGLTIRLTRLVGRDPWDNIRWEVL